jgi:regulator of RNase E activity RraA
MANTASVAGDDTTGFFAPADIRPSDWPRIDPELLAKLRGLFGLTPTASDALDELGLPLVVGSETLCPRVPGAQLVGQVLTMRYLAERRSSSGLTDPDATSRLGHRVAHSQCQRGDVVVIESPVTTASVFGGIAALDASRHGLSGVVVDGAIRDVDEIIARGLPTWSRAVTPRTGKFRLEAVQINAPISCGGCQVLPGDLVLADDNGVCFIPVEVAEQTIERILEVSATEAAQLQAPGGQS